MTTELFGPFQVLVPYASAELPAVLEACERMTNHLTAAVVSNDANFANAVLGATVNGTVAAGRRAARRAPRRTAGRPCGDPRSAGIHTPDAVALLVLASRGRRRRRAGRPRLDGARPT